tara:strand:+ start:438 stop:1556 length:1119 start_codon:yes stop_codon:yes gene_type:complete
MSKLATKQDLNKIIEKAVKRIGEDHAKIRDTKGTTITNEDIKDERKEMIEESLKAAADEVAEKLVLENTITGMVKGVMKEMGGGSGFVDNQGTSDTLTKFNERQEMGEQEHELFLIKKEDIPKESHDCVTFKEMDDTRTGKGTYAHCKYGDKLPIGNKTVGDYLTIEDCCKLGDTLDESTVDMIKKLVSKKLKNINEAEKIPEKSTPSLDQVKKSRTESGKETKQYHDEVAKKHKEYSESDKAEEDLPMHRNNEEQEEYIEDWRGMGLEDAEGVGDLERLEAYLGGSSETGNAQVDEDGNDLGNVVSTDLGKKIEKKIKRKSEKIETQKSHMRNARGYSPAVQKIDSKPVNESVKADMKKIKELFNYNKKTQ